MPRIRRWFPVSHEINRDREVQTLRDLFGDSMVLVWLEMLSEADRKDGKVVGTVAEIATDLAWIVSRTRPQRGVERIQNALTYMVEKGWIENRNSYFLVCNYSKFHRHREQIESREGTKEVPTRPDLDLDLTKPDTHTNEKPSLSPSELMAAWNEVCASEGLTRVVELTKKRDQKIRTRLREHPTLAFWETVLNKVIRSPFLMGNSRNGWKADLDWLITNDTNAVKIYEGRYDQDKNHQAHRSG